MKTKSTRPVFALIVALFAAGGCSSNGEMSVADAVVEQSAPQAVPAATITDLYSDGITKLIKTANYRFEVDNVQKSITAIEVAIRKYNGFISSSNLRLDNPFLENKMTIRVQNEYFHDLLKEIDQQAQYVNHRDISTEDVSKQFVDLESRLKTKREVEQRYMDILRKKAGTIEELLKAEEQIGTLHEEIEATVSRINYLRDEVRYSTINLEFYQKVEQVIADSGNSTLNDMRDALMSGWNGLIAAITAILYLWPLLLFSGAATIGYRIVRKRVVKQA